MPSVPSGLRQTEVRSVGKKIRLRQRRGHVKEAGRYMAWEEYQVVDGRRVVGRFDFVYQALEAHPAAVVPPELKGCR